MNKNIQMALLSLITCFVAHSAHAMDSSRRKVLLSDQVYKGYDAKKANNILSFLPKSEILIKKNDLHKTQSASDKSLFFQLCVKLFQGCILNLPLNLNKFIYMAASNELLQEPIFSPWKPKYSELDYNSSVTKMQPKIDKARRKLLTTFQEYTAKDLGADMTQNISRTLADMFSVIGYQDLKVKLSQDFERAYLFITEQEEFKAALSAMIENAKSQERTDGSGGTYGNVYSIFSLAENQDWYQNTIKQNLEKSKK